MLRADKWATFRFPFLKYGGMKFVWLGRDKQGNNLYRGEEHSSFYLYKVSNTWWMSQKVGNGLMCLMKNKSGAQGADTPQTDGTDQWMYYDDNDWSSNDPTLLVI